MHVKVGPDGGERGEGGSPKSTPPWQAAHLPRRPVAAAPRVSAVLPVRAVLPDRTFCGRPVASRPGWACAALSLADTAGESV
jgi:hypothetical protein